MLIRLQRIYNFLIVPCCYIINLGCFIIILYQFLVVTYWHSAKCEFLFFHVFYITENQYQMESKYNEVYDDFLWTKRKKVGPGCTWGSPEEGTTHQGTPGGPSAPWSVVPTSGAPRTASLLYKYPNIPETLGDSTKINSSRHRVQNHQIQYRHHHGGVHHFHWCLSYDAWVVLCRPTGP